MKLRQDARTCEQGKNCFKLANHLDIAACLGIILLLQLEMQVHFSGEEALTCSILQVITLFEENSSCSIPCLLITYTQQPEILVITLICSKSTTLQLVFFLWLQYKVLQLFCLLLLSTKTTPLKMKEKLTKLFSVLIGERLPT